MMAGMSDAERALGVAAEQVAALLAAAGMQRMQARVLTSLMTSETGQLTSQELQERLQVSAAAVSGAVRSLQNIGLIHRMTEPGGRRDVYALPGDSWYGASMQVDRIYLALSKHVQDAVDALDEDGSPRWRRLQEMADFFRFMSRRLPELLAEWNEQRSST
jgi:DNA-binding transcriptional regulator GbsR (MarR family)